MVFDNVLSMVNPATVLKRSWFVEWFYGDDLKSLWDKNDLASGATFVMADDVDEGFAVLTAATDANRATITVANTERHFDPRASVLEDIWRRVNTPGITFSGFGNRTDGDVGNTPDEAFVVQDRDATTFVRFFTVRNVTTSIVLTTLLSNTDFHRHRLELDATSARGWIDGILEATITTNLPLSSSKLYAGFRTQSRTAAIAESHIRYMEAFNT